MPGGSLCYVSVMIRSSERRVCFIRVYWLLLTLIGDAMMTLIPSAAVETVQRSSGARPSSLARMMTSGNSCRHASNQRSIPIHSSTAPPYTRAPPKFPVSSDGALLACRRRCRCQCHFRSVNNPDSFLAVSSCTLGLIYCQYYGVRPTADRKSAYYNIEGAA